ncbi:MAG: hypothetical protein EZS28_056654, partial [Streblomastix strix]
MSIFEKLGITSVAEAQIQSNDCGGVQDALLAFAIIGFIVAAVGWVIAIINLFFPLYTF